MLVANHREIPAGLIVDEVMGFRRFYESEFSADLPPTLLRCERYLAGAFRRGAEVWPVFSVRALLESPAVPAGRGVLSRRPDPTRDGDDMTNRIDAARLQPMLLGVALVAALLAAVALLLSGRAMQQQAQLREHMSSLTALAQNIPLQAGAAVRGSAPAFDALAASRARLERVIDEIDAGKSAVGLLSSPSARVLGSERGWPALLEQSQAVLDGRDAALQAQKAAASVREATPAVAVDGSRCAEGDGSRPSRCRESQLRALRAARAGDRPGPHRACRRHGRGRGGVAPPHRQPRVHGRRSRRA